MEMNKSNNWTRVLTGAIRVLVYLIYCFVVRIRAANVLESDISRAKEPDALSAVLERTRGQKRSYDLSEVVDDPAALLGLKPRCPDTDECLFF